MSGVAGVGYLAWRHLLHRKGQAITLIVCLTLAMLLPATTNRLVEHYRHDLAARAQKTPLVLGARGNRFDLTLSALYFRSSDLEPVPLREMTSLAAESAGLLVPMNLRHTAQGRPIVATSVEYFERRRLVAVEGRLPLWVGECVVGADVSDDLDIAVGDSVFSDVRQVYDISKPAAVKLRVVGRLARARSPDDHGLFVDLRTAGLLEGMLHGHVDVVNDVDETYLLGRSEDHVAVSPALIEYNEATEKNRHTFHDHGDPGRLPLSAVLVFPRDRKAGTLLKAKVNTERTWQVVVPTEVVDDLMAFVFRIKSILDGVAVLMGVITFALGLSVILLSIKARAREIETLHRIGCGRWTVAAILSTEVLIVVGVAALLAAVGTWVSVRWLPDLLLAA